MFGLEFVAGRFVKATLKSAANQVLSDKIARTVKRHAWCASLVMILPTFGLDSFLFIVRGEKRCVSKFGRSENI